jgi:hypothetical protein
MPKGQIFFGDLSPDIQKPHHASHVDPGRQVTLHHWAPSLSHLSRHFSIAVPGQIHEAVDSIYLEEIEELSATRDLAGAHQFLAVKYLVDE